MAYTLAGECEQKCGRLYFGHTPCLDVCVRELLKAADAA